MSPTIKVNPVISPATSPRHFTASASIAYAANTLAAGQKWEKSHPILFECQHQRPELNAEAES